MQKGVAGERAAVGDVDVDDRQVDAVGSDEALISQRAVNHAPVARSGVGLNHAAGGIDERRAEQQVRASVVDVVAGRFEPDRAPVGHVRGRVQPGDAVIHGSFDPERHSGQVVGRDRIVPATQTHDRGRCGGGQHAHLGVPQKGIAAQRAAIGDVDVIDDQVNAVGRHQPLISQRAVDHAPVARAGVGLNHAAGGIDERRAEQQVRASVVDVVAGRFEPDGAPVGHVRGRVQPGDAVIHGSFDPECHARQVVGRDRVVPATQAHVSWRCGGGQHAHLGVPQEGIPPERAAVGDVDVDDR